MHESCFSTTLSPTLSTIRFLIAARVCRFHFSLNLTFLIANKMKHLSALWISFYVKCLLKILAHFFKASCPYFIML